MLATYSGNGAFFYPFVTVHDSKVELGEPPNDHERKIAFIHNLSDVRVIVTDDGLVCLISQEKERALAFLKTIFATALTWKIPSQQIKKNDLCTFKWDGGSDVIQIPTHKIPSVRNQLAFERDEKFADWRIWERTLVPPDELKKLLDRAYEYNAKPELQEDILLLGEAWSLYYDEAWTAAFLYAWMMIETFMTRMWDQYVDTSPRSSDDKKSLKDHRSWTSYHFIEVFSIEGKMTPKARDALNKLRKKRNHIIHDRDKVKRDDVKPCLDIAAKIFYNQVHNRDEPFLNVK